MPATANLVSYLKFMEYHDNNGNTRIQLKKARDIYTLIKRINLFEEESVIFLPFDQSIGKLNSLMNMPEIRQDFANVFSLPLYFSPFNYRYACIHIRRGDCTPNAFPEWYVEDSFYEKLIKCLLELLPSDYKIHVCTQGDIEWIINLTRDKGNGRIIINTTSQLFTNDREIEDFFIMQRSNILFAAGSSFSHMASWCGNQELLFDVNKGRINALSSSITLGVDERDWSTTLKILKRELKKISYT